MSLFINKDGTRKSPLVMMGFLIALLFAGVFVLLYLTLTELLYQHVSIGGSETLSTMVHCLLIAILGTAVCCVFFLLPDKRIVPTGFAFLAIFMGMCYCAAFMLDGEGRTLLLYFITLHFLAPVLVGNATAWAIYFRVRKTPEKRLLG